MYGESSSVVNVVSYVFHHIIRLQAQALADLSTCAGVNVGYFKRMGEKKEIPTRDLVTSYHLLVNETSKKENKASEGIREEVLGSSLLF